MFQAWLDDHDQRHQSGWPAHRRAVVTGVGGYWEWISPEYWFTSNNPPQPVHLEICEVLQPGWNQSYPIPSCYTLDFTPVLPGFDTFYDLDFGNWRPVEATACKERDLDGDESTTGDQSPIAGWLVSLTEDGTIVDTQPTGADGCYTWRGLTPGIDYDVHEATKPGWVALGATDYVSDKAQSGDSFSQTFFNRPTQVCTPGF